MIMVSAVMQLSILYVPLLLSVGLANAATVTYDFNITWTRANPDNAFDRAVMGINNQWPIPTIRATKGDNVIVNVNNQLGNESTSLHFHGLYQNGTTHMDGPIGVTQCAIAPGGSFTYNFTVRCELVAGSVNVF
jgi:iron transport multicopper oxidase